MIRQHGSSGDSIKHLHGQRNPGFLLNTNEVSSLAGWHWGMAGASHVSKPLQYCLGLGVWSWFRPRNDQRIHAHIHTLCKSAVKPSKICINAGNRVSTAAYDPLCRSATMFATAPELIHRHSVMGRHIRHRGFPNELGPRKQQYELERLPHLLKLSTLRIGVFETFPLSIQSRPSHMRLPPSSSEPSLTSGRAGDVRLG